MVNALLNQALAKNYLNENQYEDLWKKEKHQINLIISTCKRECNEKISELKKNKTFGNDPIVIQNQAEMIESSMANRMVNSFLNFFK